MINNDYDIVIDPNNQLLDLDTFRTTIQELGIIKQNEEFITMNNSRLYDEIADNLLNVGSTMILKNGRRIADFQQKWKKAMLDAQRM